jgi:hypothetical protein
MSRTHVLSPGQFGPSLQRIKERSGNLPSYAGSVINDYSPTEEKLVPISRIKSNQSDVDAKTIRNYANRSSNEFSPVHLWRDSRGLRVFDGNHRINAAIARGETNVKAQIWEEPK